LSFRAAHYAKDLRFQLSAGLVCHLTVGRLLIMRNCQYISHMKKLFFLLILAAGCKSKGSDPAPLASALTYSLDGVATTYNNAPYVILKKGSAASPPYQSKDDVLYVIAENGTGQRGTGDPAVQVTFTKPFGSPDYNYKLYNIMYTYSVTNFGITTYPNISYGSNSVGSIQQNPSGAWSGTFAADRITGTTGTSSGTSRITQGIFIEAKL